MADLDAAKRYAQAAFGIARDSGTVATWRSQLDDVATALAESGLAPVLVDSRLPVEQRTALVERVLDVDPMVLNLARLLVAKGRAGEARAVAGAFGRLADDYEGIAHAEVTTAVELAPARLEAIARQISEAVGKQVRATGTVDPAIVGGIVVRVGDKLVDGSVRTRLKQLRRELEGAR